MNNDTNNNRENLVNEFKFCFDWKQQRIKNIFKI